MQTILPEAEKRREQLDILLKGLHRSMSDLTALAQELADLGHNGNGSNGNAKPYKARARRKRKR